VSTLSYNTAFSRLKTLIALSIVYPELDDIICRISLSSAISSVLDGACD